ncbi:MAG: archaemetzincin family Zn-dependent metalloprotease [Acidobacteria bacterium]|nr:archaemetzincin family Zn-dependent metalloprotease [Acidobacteriota bacterium]
MRAIHLMPVGAPGLGEPAPEMELLDALAAALARVFQVSCHVRPGVLDAGATHEPGRRQFHATAILRAMIALEPDPEVRLLGIAEFDLFVPVLTFVFGEAQLRGNRGLVSLHRLREEFYGLPPNPELTAERLAKEALHELGHTFGLRHCPQWECAMASSHTVERLDLKQAQYCAACRQTLSGSV